MSSLRYLCGLRGNTSRLIALSLTVSLIVLTKQFLEHSYTTRPSREVKLNRAWASSKAFKSINGSSAKPIRKWIILTTINPPTEAVKSLAQLEGWQLLVVGDTKTPKDWSWPGVIFLDFESQFNLGYSIINHIAEKSYPRKNLGYLYAIQHGAQLIYETDDDNVPWPKLDLSSFMMDRTYTGVIVDHHGPFNQHAHFGQSSTWPRGFPLASVAAQQTREYFVDTIPTPSVQQGLVNGDPDMDAIFRLTRKQKDINLNITFDSTSPPLVLPLKSITPYNSQNTMFHYRAFWSLPLPVSVSFRVTDIWRSYWAQPLMWLLGERVMYLPPNAFQKRNVHSYVLDAIEEFQLYRQSDDFVEFLLGWTCDKSDFVGCAVQLSYDMATKKFWGDRDATFIESWFNDLQAIGYIIPKRLKETSPQNKKGNILYYPVEQPSSMPNAQANQKLEADDTTLVLEDTLLKTCPSSPTNIMQSLKQIVPLFPDVLLIIFVQKGKLQNIPLLELKYKPHFPSIVYCGLDSNGEKDAKRNKISYISINVMGSNGYNTALSQCIVTALRMNYGVQGYLFIQDDVILTVQRLSGLDRQSFWFTTPNDQSVVINGGNLPGIGKKVESPANKKPFSAQASRTVAFEKCITQYQKQFDTVKYKPMAQFQLIYIPKLSISPELQRYLYSGKVSDDIFELLLLACADDNIQRTELKPSFQQSYFHVEKVLDRMHKTANLLCDVILPTYVWSLNKN